MQVFEVVFLINGQIIYTNNGILNKIEILRGNTLQLTNYLVKNVFRPIEVFK